MVCRLEEIYSFWPPKVSPWQDHISSEWHSKLFLMEGDHTDTVITVLSGDR